jgi:hypothetical protein
MTLNEMHQTIMPPRHSFEPNRDLSGDFCRICNLPAANRLHSFDGKTRAWIDGR